MPSGHRPEDNLSQYFTDPINGFLWIILLIYLLRTTNALRLHTNEVGRRRIFTCDHTNWHFSIHSAANAFPAGNVYTRCRRRGHQAAWQLMNVRSCFVARNNILSTCWRLSTSPIFEVVCAPPLNLLIHEDPCNVTWFTRTTTFMCTPKVS